MVDDPKLVSVGESIKENGKKTESSNNSTQHKNPLRRNGKEKMAINLIILNKQQHKMKRMGRWT